MWNFIGWTIFYGLGLIGYRLGIEYIKDCGEDDRQLKILWTIVYSLIMAFITVYL